MSDTPALLDRACDAMLELAGEKPWKDMSLREIAQKADISLADLFDLAHGKNALLEHLSARLDRAALATAATPSEDVHDRLFDAAMARVEVMEPHRVALLAIYGGGLLPILPHLPRTARAILEGAGVDATPPRLAAMTAVWARIAQVWAADSGALNRTMAEIDKRLKQMRNRLERVGAGF